MRFGPYSFGSIEIDGENYEHDVVIDHGEISKRKKGPSKELRSRYGHTPLSGAEQIPWDCERLVIGTGATGSLPLTDDIEEEATRRGVRVVALPTHEAIQELERSPADTNAILHLTC
jgi:hypothetical protein